MFLYLIQITFRDFKIFYHMFYFYSLMPRTHPLGIWTITIHFPWFKCFQNVRWDTSSCVWNGPVLLELLISFPFSNSRVAWKIMWSLKLNSTELWDIYKFLQKKLELWLMFFSLENSQLYVYINYSDELIFTEWIHSSHSFISTMCFLLLIFAVVLLKCTQLGKSRHYNL